MNEKLNHAYLQVYKYDECEAFFIIHENIQKIKHKPDNNIVKYLDAFEREKYRRIL